MQVAVRLEFESEPVYINRPQTDARHLSWERHVVPALVPAQRIPVPRILFASKMSGCSSVWRSPAEQQQRRNGKWWSTLNSIIDTESILVLSRRQIVRSSLFMASHSISLLRSGVPTDQRSNCFISAPSYCLLSCKNALFCCRTGNVSRTLAKGPGLHMRLRWDNQWICLTRISDDASS